MVKAKVSLTHTVTVLVEAESTEQIEEWLCITTPEKAVWQTNRQGNFVSDQHFEEEIENILLENSKVDLIISREMDTIAPHVLIRTDGYDIDTWKFSSCTEAQMEMQKQYNAFMSDELEESCKEMSYISEQDATLYANGETVYVWKIISAGN
ncbi:MAG: hypothetical protein Q4B26_00905 [Eubacteriales bacterium]|nr:hypothetical protein [Eubacteriales bacterium]